MPITGRLERHGMGFSTDGRSCALDNVFAKRLWWDVKCEEVYTYDYQTMQAAWQG